MGKAKSSAFKDPRSLEEQGFVYEEGGYLYRVLKHTNTRWDVTLKSFKATLELNTDGLVKFSQKSYWNSHSPEDEPKTVDRDILLKDLLTVMKLAAQISHAVSKDV